MIRNNIKIEIPTKNHQIEFSSKQDDLDLNPDTDTGNLPLVRRSETEERFDRVEQTLKKIMEKLDGINTN